MYHVETTKFNVSCVRFPHAPDISRDCLRIVDGFDIQVGIV